jgi:hypothetical protein
MTKSITVGFGAIILIITYYASLTHSSLLAHLMDISTAAHLIRAVAVLLVGLYCFTDTVRSVITKFAMQFTGIGLIATGFLGMFTSQLNSSFGYNALILDMFFAINWGVVALLTGLERPVAQRPTFSVARTVSRAKAKKTPRMRTKTA